VITNLLSTIPFIGQTLVESNNIIYFINKSLPTIGIINKNALKKGRKEIRKNKEEYLLIPSSFLAFLTGLIDGDGSILINKSKKGFISIKLVISLHLRDITTLVYIYSILKIGTITKYPDIKSPKCKFIINKTDLQEIFFPLLLYQNIFFLTNTRRNQFNTAMYIFEKDIKHFELIPSIETIPILFKLPISSLDYLKLHFFKN
jgi:hypothetical protein